MSLPFVPIDIVNDLTSADETLFERYEEALGALLSDLPTDGELPVWNASLQKFVHRKLVVADLPPGTNGQILSTVGGAVVWATPAAPAAGSPVGQGGIWFSNTPPADHMILDGSTVAGAQTLYPVWWGVTDAAWKSGSNIVLPDLRGRIPIGKGTHTEVDALGENDGLAVGSRTPKHNTQVNESPHSHSLNNSWLKQGTGPGAMSIQGSVPDLYYETGAANAASTGITAGPGGTRPTDTIPHVVVNWIVRYQ